MTPCTADLVKDFVAEVSKVKFTDTPGLHTLDRRLALCDMVRTEVGGDDVVELAVRSLADALTDLCFTPGDVDAHVGFVKAKRTLLEMLATAL